VSGVKIYTKIVFDMNSPDLVVLEEESFNYSGPVAHCGGGGIDVDVPAPPAPPGPSAEEIELQRAQLEELRSQREIQAGLEPILLRQSGLRRNAEGGIEEIPEGELPPEAAAARQIQNQLQQRQLAALSGTLPVDPTLEAQLGQEEEQLRLGLQRGPGLQSSPGIAALGQFQERAARLRASARTGQITTGEQLLLARSGLGLAASGQRQQQAGGFRLPTIGAIGSGLGQQQQLRANLFGTQMQGFGAQTSAFSNLQQAAAAQRGAGFGAIGQGVGGLAALGTALALS
jgi:hypothetical protein